MAKQTKRKLPETNDVDRQKSEGDASKSARLTTKSKAKLPGQVSEEIPMLGAKFVEEDETAKTAAEASLVLTDASVWGLSDQEMDFSSNELPKGVISNLDVLLKRISDLQALVLRWIQVSPAEKAAHFADPLEEERMSLWVLNTLVSLGEVYCRLQGLDVEKEGINSKKDLLNRYAFKFDELEPHSHLLSRVESGPNSRLDIPAVRRFIKPALPDAAKPSEKANTGNDVQQ